MNSMLRCIQCAGLFPEETYDAQRSLCIYCAHPKPVEVQERCLCSKMMMKANFKLLHKDIFLHGNAFYHPPVPPHYPFGYAIPMPDLYNALEKVAPTALHIRYDITEGIPVEA